jgi:iron complex transport system ATP-binding protein
MTTPVLSFEDVAVHFGERQILDGISLEVAPGELVALAGPNGAGKTTLFRVAARSLRPDRGHVRVGGDEVGSLPRRELARRLAVVPQDVTIPFPFLAGEVVLMGRSPHAGARAFDTREDVDRALAAMGAVGVAHLADRPMPELSGGERQLVLCARAFAQQPDILLLDEPTAHLDLRHRIELLARVREFVAEGGSALVVSHDLDLAARTSDRLALLAGGRLIEVGPPGEVLRPEVLRSAFGVEAQVVLGPDGAPLVVPSTQ